MAAVPLRSAGRRVLDAARTVMASDETTLVRPSAAEARTLLDQLPDLANAGSRIKSLHFARHQRVLIAGDRCTCWYVNRDGWLFRYKILHSGARQILDFILPGEVFGLQACVFGSALYSVATITPTVVSAVPFEMTDALLSRDPKVAKVLLWSAVCESARLGEHVTDAGRRSAYERLAHFFLELFVRAKRAGLADDMSFHAPLTQQLIGDALGLTTIHVNRTLRLLREHDLIAIEDRRITLLDFAALSSACDFEQSYLGENARTFWRD
jgi:CRP-like cAMP-binding protein